MILPKNRDPRFITIRRGGTLTDTEHHLLAIWAAKCSERVLQYFEMECPGDNRPRLAIEKTLAWARGEITTTESKEAAYNSNAAARNVSGAAKYAALSAGQAAAVAHVPAHDLGAAAYAIKAVLKASTEENLKENHLKECMWQNKQLSENLRALVLEDQRNRNDICWNVFLPSELKNRKETL
ncbi:MAG: putative immunity protein [Mobilitalea sp.]